MATADVEQAAPTRRVPYPAFVIPALVALVGLIGFAVWSGISGNLVFYLTPTEAVEDQPADRFRLGGLIAPGSVTETSDGVRFEVTDGAVSVTVDHTGVPPQLFQDNIGVVVEGQFASDGEFRSDELLIRHDEQYRSPEGEGPYEAPSP